MQGKNRGNMKGLEICERYYETYGKSMIERCCGKDTAKITAGLAGEGSQCFGFDDDISRDHDFGPGFCIWLGEEEFDKYADKLNREYENLPEDFLGLSRRNIQDKSRLGVMRTRDFFQKYTGLEKPPENNMDWLFLRETAAAVCVNGRVFSEGDGEFTRFRKVLEGFYPEDILRKKIAARAAVMSQAGQYNLLRCLKRKDKVAAMLALAKFTESALSMIYLLNRKYMPFYKWAYRGTESLSVLKSAAEKIASTDAIISAMWTGDFDRAEKIAFDLTEGVCRDTLRELKNQGMADGDDPFLQNHLREIMSGIGDEKIGSLPPIFDYGF